MRKLLMSNLFILTIDILYYHESSNRHQSGSTTRLSGLSRRRVNSKYLQTVLENLPIFFSKYFYPSSSPTIKERNLFDNVNEQNNRQTYDEPAKECEQHK